MNQGYRLVRLHFSSLILFLFNKLYFLVRQLWLIFSFLLILGLFGFYYIFCKPLACAYIF